MTIQEELRALADELDAKPEVVDRLFEPHIDLYIFSSPGEFKADSKRVGGKRDKRVSSDGYQKHVRQVSEHVSINVFSGDKCEKVLTGNMVEERVPTGYETKLVPEYEWKCE